LQSSQFGKKNPSKGDTLQLLNFHLNKFFCSLEFFSVGFTDGNKPVDDLMGVGDVPNSYGLNPCNDMNSMLAGRVHKLECPTWPIHSVAIFGCGLLLNSKNELAVFFTHKGLLMGKF
jgi:hypothetical protein